jgi:hypothetical protein
MHGTTGNMVDERVSHLTSRLYGFYAYRVYFRMLACLLQAKPTPQTWHDICIHRLWHDICYCEFHASFFTVCNKHLLSYGIGVGDLAPFRRRMEAQILCFAPSLPNATPACYHNNFYTASLYGLCTIFVDISSKMCYNTCIHWRFLPCVR